MRLRFFNHPERFFKFRSLVAFLRGAQDSNPVAAYNLANRYAVGNGVPLDKRASFASFMKAAGLGFADAEYAVSCLLANGVGVAKDLRASRE